jgi:putative intracellular protease/amidase
MNIYLFLFDGFSDWEIAYVTPEVNKSDASSLTTISLTGEAIRSVGGLRITPDRGIHDVNANAVDMLILPGGDAWEHGQLDGVHDLVSDTISRKKTVAAICAATTFLAKNGWLKGIRHTSNAREYLTAFAPDYNGSELYEDRPAISDGNIITANGTAPIEFAREIFSAAEIHTPADIEKWFNLFKHGIWQEE